MSDDLNTAGAAALELRQAGEDFGGAVRDLAPFAERLLAAETRARIAANGAGIPAPNPPARELAADVLHAAMAPLRPYVPFVPEESGRRSAEALARLGAPRNEYRPEGTNHE
jgi:hypothetical protein